MLEIPVEALVDANNSINPDALLREATSDSERAFGSPEQSDVVIDCVFVLSASSPPGSVNVIDLAKLHMTDTQTPLPDRTPRPRRLLTIPAQFCPDDLLDARLQELQ